MSLPIKLFAIKMWVVMEISVAVVMEAKVREPVRNSPETESDCIAANQSVLYCEKT